MASRLTGDRELVAALRALGKPLPLADVDAAAKIAMAPMLKATKARYKQWRQTKQNRHFARWGRLTKNGEHVDQLIVVGRVAGNRSRMKYRLGARKRARRIAHLIEFGTAPHFQPKRGMMHPGARPQPGMAPSFEEHRGDVRDLFGIAIWARVKARVTTVGRRGRVRRRR